MCQYDWSIYTYLHVCNYTTIENKPQKRRPYNCVCVCEGESTCVCLSMCLLVTTKQQRKCCPHFVGLFQQFVCHFQPHTLRHLLTHFHSHSLPHTLAHSHTHLFNLLTRKQFSIISLTIFGKLKTLPIIVANIFSQMQDKVASCKFDRFGIECGGLAEEGVADASHIVAGRSPA